MHSYKHEGVVYVQKQKNLKSNNRQSFLFRILKNMGPSKFYLLKSVQHVVCFLLSLYSLTGAFISPYAL